MFEHAAGGSSEDTWGHMIAMGGIVTTIVLAALGVAWRSLSDKIDAVGKAQQDHADTLNDHGSKIAVLETKISAGDGSAEDVRQQVRDANAKLSRMEIAMAKLEALITRRLTPISGMPAVGARRRPSTPDVDDDDSEG